MQKKGFTQDQMDYYHTFKVNVFEGIELHFEDCRYKLELFMDLLKHIKSCLLVQDQIDNRIYSNQKEGIEYILAIPQQMMNLAASALFMELDDRKLKS
jgi:hypothetical protein